MSCLVKLFPWFPFQKQLASLFNTISLAAGQIQQKVAQTPKKPSKENVSEAAKALFENARALGFDPKKFEKSVPKKDEEIDAWSKKSEEDHRNEVKEECKNQFFELTPAEQKIKMTLLSDKAKTNLFAKALFEDLEDSPHFL